MSRKRRKGEGRRETKARSVVFTYLVHDASKGGKRERRGDFYFEKEKGEDGKRFKVDLSTAADCDLESQKRKKKRKKKGKKREGGSPVPTERKRR